MICELIYKNNSIIINTNNNYINKATIDKNLDLTPKPYKHWTKREIYEHRDSIWRSLGMGGRIKNKSEVKLGGLETFKNIIKNIDNLILLGCGTSYFAGLLSEFYFKDLTNLNLIKTIDGADFNEKDIPKLGTTGIIFLSQSGETRDLHRGIEIAKSNHIFTIGVINVVDSMIAREVNCGVYLNSGREVAVASTKSFTSMVVVLVLIAIYIAQINDYNKFIREKYISDLKILSKNIENIIRIYEKNIQKYIESFKRKNSLFILGKGPDRAIAREGALKIKEISYIHAEGYSSSSLKHGPFFIKKIIQLSY